MSIYKLAVDIHSASFPSHSFSTHLILAPPLVPMPSLFPSLPRLHDPEGQGPYLTHLTTIIVIHTQ